MNIIFNSIENGVYKSRIDNVEIIISKNKLEFNVDIYIYENYIEVPCEYDNCPNDVELNQDCYYRNQRIDLCPFGVDNEQVFNTVCFSEYSYTKAINKIISMFKNNDDGLGHYLSWPKDPSDKFINSKWIFKRR